MRKSFTWFLSLMVFLFAFAANGLAQEAQETVELYAEDASSCYMEADDYTVTISVRDFIQLTDFDLDLQYNDAVFAYVGATGVHPSLSGTTITESAGVINMVWSGSATTIGDNVKTAVVVLHFRVLGFPGNTATSFASNMEWTKTDFWYTLPSSVKDPVNTVVATDGSLNVSVDITGIEVAFTTETCYGGEVTMSVTAPPASMYLFNEDPVVSNWSWTSSPDYLVAAGEVVTVRVKDASGCISLVDVVNVPETVQPVAFTVTTQDPTCYGGMGSVVINATGGNAPYEYWIGTADDGSDAVKKSNFQFSMAPGVYYVNVQDANGCANLPWEPISIVDNNPVLEVGATPTDILCYGEATGEIATSVVQGDLTMVSLNGVVWETLPHTFTGLAAGTYTVYAKNDVGCTVTTTATVAQPAAGITFDIFIDDTSCGGGVNDGAITVRNVAGGTAPYEYSLDGDNWQPGDVFNNLEPTYYSLWVRDANGCVKAYSNPNGTGNTIAVQSPEDINYDVVVTDPACNDEDAVVTISNVTGGSGTYEYSFDGGTTWGSDLTYNWPAPYADITVVVRNTTGDACPVSKALAGEDVDNPDSLDVVTYDILAPTCIDGNDGNVTLQITGGTAPYYYKVNQSTWKMTEDEFTHVRLNVGTHTILVKDANDCEFSGTIQVTITLEENSIVATKDGHIDCFGDNTGTISVDFNSWAEGLNVDVPYRNVTYYIQNAAGQVSAFTPSNHGGTPTTFGAGIYTVWVVDQYTCESNMDTVLVTENPELLISSVVANAASCFNSFEGIITIYATGGNTPDLEYAVVNNEGALGNITDDKWLPFDTYDNTVNPPLSTVSFNVDGGTYWIAVRDDGCDEKTYGPIVVEGYEQLLVDEEDIDWTDPLCNGDANGTITVPMSAVSGGAGAYKFTLLVDDDGDWVEVTGKVDQVTGEFTGLPAGTYAVLVEDAENCPSYTTDAITLDDPDVLSFTTDILHIRCEGTNDGVITINAIGGTPDYWYAINNTNTWVAFGAGKTSKTYIATEPGTFTIWVKDANGCLTEETEVTIEEPEALSAEVDITNVSCNGGSDGSIDITGMGGWEGMTSFEFKVNDGAWTSSTTISGLPAGTHTLYIRDANSYVAPYQDLDCVYSTTFTVTQPDVITYDVVIEDVSCKDGADGTFTVNVLSGGTPYVDLVGDQDGYDVRLTGDAYYSGWIRTGIDYSHTFTGLAHSHYTVYIQDANGCTLKPTVGDSESPYTTIESWEVAEPDTYLDFEAMWLNDATCYGSEDGAFKVVATGGTAPYKYYAGLSIPPAGGQHLLVEAPAEDSELWLDTDTLMVGAGTWVVWVMDANGCIKGGETDENGFPVNEWRVKIQQPAQVVWDWHWMGDPAYKHYVRPSCYGSADGQIHLTNISGGSGVYNASVSGISAAGDTISLSYTNIQLDGGLYKLTGVPASNAQGWSVTVTDNNGCTSEVDTIYMSQPDMLEVTLQESPDNYSCFGAVEGWIEAYATGGNSDLGVYEYQLLKNGVVHTPWQSIASAFLVEVGNEFIVQVRDTKGCMAEDTVYLPTPAKVEFTYDDLTCYDAEKPVVRIHATGTPGRQFKVWYKQIEDQPANAPYIAYNGMFDSTIVISDAFDFDNENFDDLHYAVYVEDDHGCVSMVDTLTFDQIQVPITVEWNVSNVTECTEDVTITSIVGGFGDKVITVNDSVVVAVNEAVTLPRGTHMIKITDEHECVWEQMIEVAGEYLTRDTTITTFIGGYLTEFVDAEAGVDTMLAAGMHTWVYTLDCERTLNVEVVEIPRPLTIAEVQGEGDASEWVGDIIKVTGTVTGIAPGEGFFVQDAVAARSGIWVEYSAVNDLGLAVGSGVSVVGEVAEIADVTSIQASEVMMAEGTPAITPIETTPSDAETEMYESVLVMVPGARATAALSTGQWDIYYETTNNITVNDWLYSSTPVEGHFYDVTGIVNGRLDAFLLEPRMESDVVDKTATKVDPELANAFKVYPNPFSDHINISNNEMLTRVVITNIAGQRVIDVEYPGEKIRTAHLVSGVYLVNLFNEGGLVKTDRIVKR